MLGHPHAHFEEHESSEARFVFFFQFSRDLVHCPKNNIDLIQIRSLFQDLQFFDEIVTHGEHIDVGILCRLALQVVINLLDFSVVLIENAHEAIDLT